MNTDETACLKSVFICVHLWRFRSSIEFCEISLDLIFVLRQRRIVDFNLPDFRERLRLAVLPDEGQNNQDAHADRSIGHNPTERIRRGQINRRSEFLTETL